MTLLPIKAAEVKKVSGTHLYTIWGKMKPQT